MIKKIIHIADVHIRTYRMHEEYKEIFTDFIARIKIQTEGYQHDEIRIAVVGDLVHQKITISNELLVLGCWFLGELAKVGKVVLVAGNHDFIEANKDRLDSITPMVNLLNNKDIAYYKESKCYIDDNVVWCNYSVFDDNARPNIDNFKNTHEDTDLTYIGLYHAPLAGATTDIGYEFKEGTPLSHFEGCDMALLGDIHKRQLFFHGETPIAYPSSLIQQNFGETVSKHGYLLWDLAKRTYTEHDVSSRYGFYQFKVDGMDDIDNETEKFLNP